jgi:hypothetical protein
MSKHDADSSPNKTGVLDLDVNDFQVHILFNRLVKGGTVELPPGWLVGPRGSAAHAPRIR